ncbi:MAG TPA: hypothetical protein VFG08_01065, partial [Candidatus Polarisedimenticolia bacterium]|nr:hypothetical protein [Candidatus Polarisedimenticolia bacterium]
STEPLVIRAEHDLAGTELAWPNVPDAVHYSVVRGSLDRVREKLNRYDLGQLTCIARNVTLNRTEGFEEGEDPEPGKAFFYLVEYFDGAWSGLGTVSAAKERSVAPGQADCR